jgi:hypothetical protein
MRLAPSICLIGLLSGITLSTHASSASSLAGGAPLTPPSPAGPAPLMPAPSAAPASATAPASAPAPGTAAALPSQPTLGDVAAAVECCSPQRPEAGYQSVVQKTANMVGDGLARKLASDAGLDLVNLTWEDTGRYKGSAVGPNISDMTIQVQQRNPAGDYSLTCMPVIRFPNFSDRTADITPDQLSLLVGNERGQALHRVSLRDYLADLRRYLSQPDSFKGSHHSLLADRDTHVLVSAQACFLPVPKQGKAEFNPVLFNYQSRRGDPAVLAILATRQGTSATIIDNQRDGFAAGSTWGQRLFFNEHGKRASMTGERLSDFKASHSGRSDTSAHIAGEEGLNMVMLIQVPLKQKERLVRAGQLDCAMPAPCGGAAPTMACAKGSSDVENAVIGHGKVEGPYTEIDNLAIERDPRYPIRVTVQFYKATSNGVMSAADASAIASQIDRVYAKADYVGSLVIAGATGRPTEHSGPQHQPASWWRDFWAEHEAQTGQTREQAMRMLSRLLGPNWEALPAEQIRETLEKARS